MVVIAQNVVVLYGIFRNFEKRKHVKLPAPITSGDIRKYLMRPYVCVSSTFGS